MKLADLESRFANQLFNSSTNYRNIISSGEAYFYIVVAWVNKTVNTELEIIFTPLHSVKVTTWSQHDGAICRTSNTIIRVVKDLFPGFPTNWFLEKMTSRGHNSKDTLLTRQPYGILTNCSCYKNCFQIIKFFL